ncbi:omptin family outer membrane protease [Fluoribacter gormanii]|uniref:Coagulase/fibrinolysin n=1 Tax=Fluoribacter gormanii TaxID=464 RepID=A0A377GGI9_9GAMM|nr:omptin family outer membrane protease [Fluoribacter gormanii]KTD02404.1 outer membrane protease [Fluoribacter gormanii]MCW8469956.1 omptin family outer membrane protease [Fluoribacter gormanii]SIR67889.1 Outer membrane protease [Fluoribacter gormanii]STO23694.1 Coagulase/fibrinolysin precursor [Fluoribacter gormanii]
MKNKIVMLALSSLSLTYSLDTYAADYSLDGLSLSTSVGILSGKAHEYVYYPRTNTKLSQLDWRIKDAAIINGELNYELLSWLGINGRGWSTVAKNKAAMDDYDWFNPNQESWTHWSHHENTHLNYANEFDLSLRAWLMQKQNYQLGLAAGYQWDSFSWRATGGCYQYNNGSDIGCFPSSEAGIGYQQKFRTPYVGLAGKYFIHNFEFNALLKFSNWVTAQDHDEHYARNITFEEHGDNFRYYAATINSGYFFTPNAKVFVEASYNHYSNGRADTEIIDNDTGENGYERNAAGLSNKNYTLALGLQYLF